MAVVDRDATREYGLFCVECGTLSDHKAERWRAYIAFIEEDDESPEVAVYCPDCAAFEFGAADG
jgi:hypothetical protein